MDLRFWAATDTGRVRDHNEDNFLVDKRLQLFVVCDGMGGHAAGEVASAVCVRTVREVIAGAGELITHVQEAPEDPQVQQAVVDLLRQAVQAACARIFEMAQQDTSRRGMGTTCTALLISGAHGFVGHVGDSRLYRVRQGEVEQVTTDHSLLNEMIRQGKLPADTRERDFPHNNAVTRAVGVREFVEVDAFEFGIDRGDRMMMCSDGLSGYFEEEIDVLDMTSGDDLQEIITRCIDFANESGGKDNITVIVVDAVDAQANQPDQALELVRATSYFHYLSGQELEHIWRLGKVVEFEPDQEVTSPVSVAHCLFVILKGSVSLHLDGKRVSVLTTGEHFGEMALIDAQDDNDNRLLVRSLEPTTLFSIARDEFMGILRSDPGLAIKLLWNFVQVFADRLQSVPAEYRFSPDDWREDPDASADFTPPSGSLVFTEDIRRIEERFLAESANFEASVGGQDSESAVEDDVTTQDAGRDGLESASSPQMDWPPASSDALSESEMEADGDERAFAHRPTLRLDAFRDDFDGDTTLNPWDNATSQIGDSNSDASDAGDWTFGSIDDAYDDSDPEPPSGASVSFGRAAAAGADEDLRATVQFERPLSREGVMASMASSFSGAAGSVEGERNVDEDVAKTVDLDADLARLRSLRAESSLDLKERLRQRMKTRTPAGLSQEDGANVSDESSVGRGAMAGESEVRSTHQPRAPEVGEEAKIMISPELMGLVDDDEV
ncbi:hypothetical protein DL240_06330 [Lujinxingia litoralis]|uniref:Stp1/IreP family PP2C-type Ser/Thr phosphatase n=1 Tax=Lujinxingia litoralis TaxID=2211119 RepID=A0A328CA10_9DELT|nr:protein phosphatase 2C domain-containing protein [Lujinxingia litoralis]RAL23768.1 hypothetical protein DL240_06330 [Lujinxingia litoralis]